MPTKPRDGLPEFWTTTIAKALSGDQPCLLSPWLSGHMRLEKRPREDAASLAKWKTDHTAALNDYVTRLKAQGWKCSVERYFRVEGASAILAGKADVVAQQADKRPLIVDVKTGQPRDSDLIQVMIEIVMIPIAWNSPSMLFEGEVVYRDHTVKITNAQAQEMKPKIVTLLKQLALTRRPDAAPGLAACRWCDVSEKDCPDRFNAEREPEPVGSTTELF